MTEKNASSTRRAWWILILPPLLFLVLTILASLAIGFAVRGDPEQIESGTTAAVPYILLFTQLLMALLLWRFTKADGLVFADIGWRLREGQKPLTEILIAIGVAIPLMLVNQFALLPITEWLQINVGDYVPPGAVGETLGAAAVVTAISAVILAPFVEESLYRGYATRRLREKLGPVAAFLIVMVFFALLHWAQGVWSMLYTMVAHAIFAGLALWRGNLYAAWMTHLLFNGVELALLFL